jgi:ornithine carbamoyltransferase
MKPDLNGRSFTKLLDFSSEEIHYLVNLGAALKKSKKEKREKQTLTGKNIVLVFEKSSTRTRSSFEVAAADQGASTTYLGPTGTHFGKKESVKDTARVLGGIYDGIAYRGFAQETVEALAEYSGVPVWNGLTDKYHPTQVIGDLLTMREHSGKKFHEMTLCYVGDTRNNVAYSLMIGGIKLGMNIKAAGPEELNPETEIVETCKKLARETRGNLTITHDAEEGAEGADFIYTDVWLSMGEDESLWKKRIDLLTPFQVNNGLMNHTGTETKFMHCLPSIHNTETELGKKVQEKFGIQAMEVTDDVFESGNSIVFQQAVNRMHTIKAIMAATLGEE